MVVTEIETEEEAKDIIQSGALLCIDFYAKLCLGFVYSRILSVKLEVTSKQMFNIMKMII